MSAPARPRKRRRAVGLVFNVLVTGLSFWFLWSVVRDTGFETVGRRLLDATPWIVAVTAVANIVRFMLLGLRWEILVRTEAPMGFGPILKILMAGNFLQLVAPGLRVAGPVLRAWYLSKETGRRRARFYGTIVADQTANFSLFVVVMVVSGFMTASSGSQQSVTGGLAVLAALVMGLYLAKRQLERIKAGEPTLIRKAMGLVTHARPESEQVDDDGNPNPSLGERFVNWWDHMLEALTASTIGKGTWWPAIGVSAVLFVVLTFSMKMAFAAIGAEISMAQAAFVISIAAFIQMLAAAPGGPGITEASLVLSFMTLGMDPGTAAAGSFLARLVNYAVLIPWGGWCFLRLQKQYGVAPTSDEKGTMPRTPPGPPAPASPPETTPDTSAASV